MHKSTLLVTTLFIVTTSALVAVSARQAPTKQAPSTPAQIDELLKTMRADMQTTRADILAKNMTMTAAEAAKFWPLFETYQKEQNLIMDEQMARVQKFTENFNTLDDAGAVAFLTAHFDRDTKMNALRQKFFKEFQTVLPVKQAARAMQIDRRLSLIAQLELSARLPLVH